MQSHLSAVQGRSICSYSSCFQAATITHQHSQFCGQ
jgi:hypothetical protein